MRLAEVTSDNFPAAIEIAVRPDQQDLVAPVVKSLAEAYLYPQHALPRLVYDGDEVVGFVMAFLDAPWPDGGTRSGIWRLAIDASRQGRGYGTFAVQAVCSELRSYGAERAYVTWEPRAGGPEPFYLKLGFQLTGETMEGQAVGVRELS
jgi:diamine N-acetyltransferase